MTASTFPLALAPEPSQRPACAGDFCAPPGCLDDSGPVLPEETDDVLLLEQAVPLVEVAEYWKLAAEQVQLKLDKVVHRSEVISEEHRRLTRGFEWMFRVHHETLALVKSAAAEPDAYEEQMKLDAAAARMEALVLALRAISLRLNYLLLADVADEIKVARPHWVVPLVRVQHETDVVLAALAGFNPERMERAAVAQAAVMAEMEAFVPRWHETLVRTAKLGRQVTLVVDAVTLLLRAYQAYGALGAAGGGGTALAFRFPALAAAGGAAVAGGRTVVISAEVLESIRRLVEIGAISGVVLWAGASPVVKGVELAPQGQHMMRSAGGSGTGGQAGPAQRGRWPGRVDESQGAVRAQGSQVPAAAHRPASRRGLRRPRPGRPVDTVRWLRRQATQADRGQVGAANGIPVEWHVAEKELADLLKKLFGRDAILRQIKIIHAPLLP